MGDASRDPDFTPAAPTDPGRLDRGNELAVGARHASGCVTDGPQKMLPRSFSKACHVLRLDLSRLEMRCTRLSLDLGRVEIVVDIEEP